MLGANATTAISRPIKAANGQSTYADPHARAEAYYEPVSMDLVLAQGEPVGKTSTYYYEDLETPDDIQNQDLITDDDRGKFIVTGIQPYENHLVVSVVAFTPRVA